MIADENKASEQKPRFKIKFFNHVEAILNQKLPAIKEETKEDLQKTKELTK